MTDQVIVPMAMLGAALLLYVGFFTAMREWIQGRISGKKAAAAAGPLDPSKLGPGFTTKPPTESIQWN